MPDQNLVKQVQRSYERMKHGKIKGFLQSMVVYAVMVGVISLFLGNPLPHRETILFFFCMGLRMDLYMYDYLSLICWCLSVQQVWL